MRTWRTSVLMLITVLALTIIALSSHAMMQKNNQNSTTVLKLYIYPNACIKPEIVIRAHSFLPGQLYSVTNITSSDKFLEITSVSKTSYKYSYTVAFTEYNLSSYTKLVRKNDVLRGNVSATYLSSNEYTSFNLSITIRIFNNNTMIETISGVVRTNTEMPMEKPRTAPGVRILEYVVEKIDPDKYRLRVSLEAPEEYWLLVPPSRLYLPLSSSTLMPGLRYIDRLEQHVHMYVNKSSMVSETRARVIYRLSLNQYLVEYARYIDYYLAKGNAKTTQLAERIARQFLDNFSLGQRLEIVMRGNSTSFYIGLPSICGRNTGSPKDTLIKLKNFVLYAATLLNVTIPHDIIVELKPATKNIVISNNSVSFYDLDKVDIVITENTPSPRLISLIIATAIIILLVVAFIIMVKSS